MKRFPCCLLAVLLAVLAAGGGHAAPVAEPAYTIRSLTLAQEAEEWQLLIAGNSPPVYTAYRLFDPLRLVIDIADARLDEQAALPAGLPRGPVREIRRAKLAGPAAAMIRLEILLTGEPEYQSTSRQHDIVVTFSGRPDQEAGTAPVAANAAKQAPAAEAGRSKEAVAAIIADLKKERPPEGVVEAVRPQLPPLEEPAGRPAAVAARPRSEAKAAAARPRSPMPAAAAPHNVSVEFFKSDLHNVFRFFGEISGRNIVVDEAIRGELTLTLKEVPWDFALAIILNLKDLQKEERHNTIVVSPRAKTFVWPERPADQLSVRAEGLLVHAEPLAVQERLEVPRERLEARELLRQATGLDQRRQYERALALYERALTLWPDNSELAERMAAINLIHLGHNARALHFAATALRHDRQNDRAALLAAIAAAGMQRAAEAKLYFDQAIARPRPAEEALISYAAFAEEYDSPYGALALLQRHRQLYGDNLDTMISRARLHDKTGAADLAREEYRAILFSGYELPEDLRRYILTRIAAEGE